MFLFLQLYDFVRATLFSSNAALEQYNLQWPVVDAVKCLLNRTAHNRGKYCHIAIRYTFNINTSIVLRIVRVVYK